MKVTEEITNEELNAVLTELFGKVEGLESSLSDTSIKADTALSIAKAAKAGLKEIKVVPTNGWDSFNHALDTFGSIAISLGLVSLFVFIVYVLFKTETYDVEPKKEKKIKIE